MDLKTGRLLISGTNRFITLVRRTDLTQKATFQINGVVGEGGSAVCYDAQYAGKKGRLKELYPLDDSASKQFWLLERTPDNQLLPAGDAMRTRFEALCRDFEHAYDRIDQVKTANERNEILNNFLPSSEVFYGMCPDGTRGSVYIWTPDDKKGQTFWDYIAQVRSQPNILPEHKLYNILSTLITLTDCIRLLHSTGLLHLDIKPSNFLVSYNGEMNINTSSISLFDINSICPVDEKSRRYCGTPGFRAPETVSGKGENRSDIYSIGAMLFYSTVILQEPAVTVYEDRYYDRIDRMVDTSALICASQTNSSLSVKYLITRLLKKSLHSQPEMRYNCCEEMIEDLRMARSYLLPDIFSAHLGADKRLAILDQGEQNARDPIAVMQELLYHTPLYYGISEDEDEIRVLIIGAGTYGQKFMDICLQVGQMHQTKLNLTVFSKDPELNRNTYLHYRPALTHFVEVNEAFPDEPEQACAGIRFRGMEDVFLKGEVLHNTSLARDILSDCPEMNYHYIFISLGDDALNGDVARVCRRLVQKSCPVAYVIQAQSAKKINGCIPVFVNEPEREQEHASDLERMAFNAHLCWMDQNNLDMRLAQKGFRERYNYLSSMCFVLSIPYKLRSIGVFTENPAEAAKQFSRVLQQDKNNQLFGQLVALEHRRWLMEKVTQGWSAPKNMQKFLQESLQRCAVSDKTNYIHPCIVHSTAEMPLKEPDFDWDLPNERDILLDPLDQVSVQLHRFYRHEAAILKKSHPLQSEDISTIEKYCRGSSEEALRAFHRYIHCLSNILDGNRHYAKHYKQYEQDLLDTLKKKDPTCCCEAEKRLGWIHQRFFCAIERNLYRNYKSNDEVLVRKLPFILTHQPAPHIALSFDDASHDGFFSNVATAMVLHPKTLTYLCASVARKEPGQLLQRIKSTVQFLRRRHIHAEVNFLVAAEHDSPQATIQELHKGMEQLQSANILADFSVLVYNCAEEASRLLTEALLAKKPTLFDSTNQALPANLLNAGFLSRIKEHIPYFTFDRLQQRFPVYKGCDSLQYIQEQCYLRAADLLDLMELPGRPFNYPEFAEDYRTLWSVYTGEAYLNRIENIQTGARNWNRLCRTLAAHSRQQDLIADIPLDPRQQGEEKHMTFFFPSYCYRAVEYLICRMIEEQVLKPDSTVCSHTADACRAELYTVWNVGEILEDLLSSHAFLADQSLLRVETQCSKNVTHVMFRYNNLAVTNLIPEDPASITVLDQLCKVHFINKLHCNPKNPGQIGFIYSAPGVKKILTSPHEILKLYTYHEAKKLGYFDDVACGFINDNTCVLTKGMQALTVEYAPVENADSFIISAKKPLGPSPEKEYIIQSPEDIRNIGCILQTIMEND